MKLLVFVHVMSAIVGVGPTFYGHVLMRRNQSLSRLKESLSAAKRLEYFPKIGGTLAVLTGILLIILSNYGPFMQLWLVGALIVYIYIQVVAVGLLTPTTKRLSSWVFDPANANADVLPKEQTRLYHRANGLLWAASGGGVLLFALMILKPVVQL